VLDDITFVSDCIQTKYVVTESCDLYKNAAHIMLVKLTPGGCRWSSTSCPSPNCPPAENKKDEKFGKLRKNKK